MQKYVWAFQAAMLFNESVVKKSFATRLEVKDQIMTFTNQSKATHQLCMGDTLIKDLILATWHT